MWKKHREIDTAFSCVCVVALALPQVNAKVDGKTALHLAAAEGYTHVIKTLLDFSPLVDAEVGTLSWSC